MVPYRIFHFHFHFHFHLQNLWQVAMVPYRMERGQLVAIAPPSCSARYSSNSFILFKTYLENNLISNHIYCILQASELIITFSDLTGWIWDNMPWQSFFFFWARCASFLKCPPFVNMIVLRWYSADYSQQCTAGFERTKVLWSEWKFFVLCWVWYFLDSNYKGKNPDIVSSLHTVLILGGLVQF